MLLILNGEINKMSKYIDLTSYTNFVAQLENAKKYERKSAPSKIAFIGLRYIGILFFIIINIEHLYNYQIIIIFLKILLILIFIFILIYTPIFARCPHCNKLQQAKYLNLNLLGKIEIEYGKGFSPFAKRCCKCNYYLSVKTLLKDRDNLYTEIQNKHREDDNKTKI